MQNSIIFKKHKEFDSIKLQKSGSSLMLYYYSGSIYPVSSFSIGGGESIVGYVPNSQTSSFVTNEQTSSFVTNTQTSSFVTNEQTSSFVTNEQTSSFVTNQQTSSFVTNTQTSSFVTNQQTSSFVTNEQTSSFVTNSQTSSMSVAKASEVIVTNNTTGVGPYYVTFTSDTGSSKPILVDSNGLLFNATTNTLTTTASFAQTASYALNATGGGIGRSVNSISTNTTAGNNVNTDYIYLVTGTTDVTLPTAIGNTNLYTVKRVGTNTVKVIASGSQTIDGSPSASLNVQYTALTFVSDNTNWNII